MAVRMDPIVLDHVQLIFKNFSGAPDKFNKDGGKRYFDAILPAELANRMIKEGWNIKTLRSRDEDEPDLAHIKININFNGRQPPKMVLITSKGKTSLRTDLPEGQEMAAIFDMVDVAFADIKINPYKRDADSPVTAYLHYIYVTVHEDEIEKRYTDVPELEYNAPTPLQIAAEAADMDNDIMELEASWDDEG